MTELNRYDLQFCLRRCPVAVLELLKRHGRTTCIAGGFIRSVIANERINDVDIFAGSGEQALTMAKELAGYKRQGDELHRRIINTDNAFTVRGFAIDPQIVHRWTFEDIHDVVPSFDFTIACAAIFWDSDHWRSICDDQFYPDLAAKRLVYRSPARNEDAGGSMLRVLKFYQRGYRIPLDSLGAVIARMCQGISLLGTEKGLAKIFTERLREVDPAIDPNHIAHLESLRDEE